MIFPWLVSALLFAAGTGDLEPVPEPVLDGLEPAVRAQLDAAEERLERAGQAENTEKSAAWADLGQLYLLYERPASARPALANALRLAPDDATSLYYLGVVHQDAGRFDEAARTFERVVDLAESEDLAGPSRLRLGEARLRLRELDAAERAFARAVELDPDSAAGHYGLGRVARERREWRDAADRFALALDLQPDADAVHHPLALALRQLGDLDGARAALQEAGTSAPTFPDPPIRRLLDRSASGRSHLLDGNRARRRGLYDLALESYRRAVAVDPGNAQAHYNLGALFGELGRVAEAETAFRAALAQDPEHRDSHFNLAVGLRARGRHTEAAEHFAAAVDADPADHAARLELGVTLAAAGRTREGRAELDKVRDADPRDPAVLLQLARYLDALDDSAAAEAVLGRALEIAVAPEDRARARFARARLLARAGRWAETRALLEATLEAAHEATQEAARETLDEPAVLDALAKVLATSPDADVRDGEKALVLADRLAAIRPGPEARETRAMALAAAGRFAEAVAVQEDLLRGAGGAPPAILDRLRTNLGRYRDGRIALPPW